MTTSILHDSTLRKPGRASGAEFSWAVEKAPAVIPTPFPSRRLAVYEGPLRNELSQGKRLLFLSLENGQVLHAFLLPYRHEGWFMIVSLLYESGGETNFWCAAALTRSAIGAIVGSQGEANPVKAMASEMLDWSYTEMKGNQYKSLIIPTAHGYFCGGWNDAEETVVLNTWFPDRVLNETEIQVLAKLREGKKLVTGEKLAV